MITLFLFSIMESENEKWKDGIYTTWLFSVYPVFILQKKKTKMGIVVFDRSVYRNDSGFLVLSFGVLDARFS